MSFEFSKLPLKARRAAFAHMHAKTGVASKVGKPKATGGKSLGTGAVHKKLTSAPGGKTGQLSGSYIKTGRASEKDVSTMIANYRAMHGRDPSPQQIAKIRRA